MKIYRALHTGNWDTLIGRPEVDSQDIRPQVTKLLQQVKDNGDPTNAYAPEHLIIMTRDPHAGSLKISNAGSVFLGDYHRGRTTRCAQRCRIDPP